MSYILAYTGTPQPCCSIGHYASLIIYYSPDETVDAFLKRLPAFFLPKYKRMASQFGGKVETAISTFLNHCREVEKMVDEKEACEDEKKEEEEFLPIEQTTKITSFFKGGSDVESDVEKEGDVESDVESEKEGSDESEKEGNVEREGKEQKTKITSFFKGHSEKEGNEDSEEDDDYEANSNSEDDNDMVLDSDSDCSHEGSHCSHGCQCGKRDHCDCSDDETLPLKRHHASCLHHTNEEYLSWKSFGCRLPLLLDPYASIGQYELLPEWFVNSLVLAERAQSPLETLFTEKDENIPSCDIIVDGDVEVVNNSFMKRVEKEESNPEEDAALDELNEVHSPKIVSMHYCKTPSWREKNHVVSEVPLSQCFDMFKRKGDQDPKCKWFCPHCQKDVLAASSSFLWKSPRYLIIQLSRFEYVTNEQLGGLNVNFENRKRKVETKVVFPLKDLDISEYVHEDEREGKEFHYDLVAVCNHFGKADYGHYVAFCRDNNDGEDKWYRYDDDIVTPMKEEEVVTADAYMLIYQRQGVGNISTKDVLELVKGK